MASRGGFNAARIFTAFCWAFFGFLGALGGAAGIGWGWVVLGFSVVYIVYLLMPGESKTLLK